VSLHLRAIAATNYARKVLPLTASLWAGSRDLPTYIAQTTELARSSYGRRFYRTIGLFDGDDWLASCKRYERTMRVGSERLRAVGFGAVFTPPPARGKGYATMLLALLMDEARSAAFDAAYLFSDIHPAFYAALGFQEYASTVFSLRSDSLRAQRLRCSPLTGSDWDKIAQCYDASQRAEPWGFLRSRVVWNWIRLRARQRSEQCRAQSIALAARDKHRLIAYILGERYPKRDLLELDEFGWADEAGRAAIQTLLKNAAGDLRKIGGWLPPSSALELLPRHTKRKRRDAILMIAPLSGLGKRLGRIASGEGAADAVWPTDHI